MSTLIRQGERWDEYRRALRDAVRKLDRPLSKEELAHGWTSSYRQLVHSYLSEQCDLMQESGEDFAPDYSGWIKSEVLKVGADDARWSTILRTDRLALSINLAEECVDAAERLLSLLTELTDEKIVLLKKELGRIRHRLVAGEYLTSSDVQAFRKAMNGLEDLRGGYLRHSQFLKAWLSVIDFDRRLSELVWVDDRSQ